MNKYIKSSDENMYENEIQLTTNLVSPTNDQDHKLSFLNVNYNITKGNQQKSIIKNITGEVSSGELMYIMGPSGCGKTTLLDFLTNRTKQDPKFNLFINEKGWSYKEYQKISKYCQQTSEFFEILTVEQTLRYTASFYCNSQREKNDRVNQVIRLLRLENQRDVKIGGNIFRGISGGQRQRVAIGEQLLGNPKILFLDEPTSGLDSAAAYNLMDNLKTICKSLNIAIVCTIHQPSQRVFDTCDKLLLLSGGKQTGGNIVFFGQRELVEPYFESIGIKNETKQSWSEYILDIVNEDYGKPDLIKNLIEKYSQSDLRKNTQSKVETIKMISTETYRNPKRFIRTTDWTIIKTLTLRNSMVTLKNPVNFLIRLFIFSLMSSVLGVVWQGAAVRGNVSKITLTLDYFTDPSSENPFEKLNPIQDVLFFTCCFYSIMSICILPAQIQEKKIMLREKQNGSYDLWHHSISTCLASLPFTFILALSSGLIIFYMVAFDKIYIDGVNFVFTLFFTLVVSESLMQIVSYIFTDLLLCIVLIAFIQGLNLILNGFMIVEHEIPRGLKIVHYLDYQKYTLQNYMFMVFSKITIQAEFPFFWFDLPGYIVLAKFDMADVKIPLNYFFLFLFFIGYRFIAFLLGRFILTGKK